MKVYYPYYTLFIALLCCIFSVHAQQSLPSDWVTDYTNTLTPAEQGALRDKLVTFEKTRGSQIVVVLVKSTSPKTIEDYSLELANNLQIGRADINDGVLVLVAKDDREVRVEVGLGLKEVVPDSRAQDIIEQHITPSFREDDFAQGLHRGVDALIASIEGGDLPPVENKPNYWLLLLLFPTVLIIELLKRITKEKWLVVPLAALAYGWLGWYVVGFQLSLALALIGFLISFLMLKFPQYHWELRKKSSDHQPQHNNNVRAASALAFLGFILIEVPNASSGSRGGSGFGGGSGFSGGGSSGGESFGGGGGSFGGDGASGSW